MKTIGSVLTGTGFSPPVSLLQPKAAKIIIAAIDVTYIVFLKFISNLPDEAKSRAEAPLRTGMCPTESRRRDPQSQIS
jgi:hypothetical protein